MQSLFGFKETTLNKVCLYEPSLDQCTFNAIKIVVQLHGKKYSMQCLIKHCQKCTVSIWYKFGSKETHISLYEQLFLEYTFTLIRLVPLPLKTSAGVVRLLESPLYWHQIEVTQIGGATIKPLLILPDIQLLYSTNPKLDLVNAKYHLIIKS